MPKRNDVSGIITAIFSWSPTGAGCAGGVSQCWLGWFPTGVNVSGANDFTTLQNGTAYFIAVNAPVGWKVLRGP